MGQAAIPGAALGSALDARGCALDAEQARAVAVLLISLICDGLIVADTSAGLPRTCNTGQSSYRDGGGSE